MTYLRQLASSSLSPALPPFAGEGANVGLRPPKAIDDAGEDVLMMKSVISLVRPPLTPTLPHEGGGSKRGLRPPTAINAGGTF